MVSGRLRPARERSALEAEAGELEFPAVSNEPPNTPPTPLCKDTGVSLSLLVRGVARKHKHDQIELFFFFFFLQANHAQTLNAN